MFILIDAKITTNVLQYGMKRIASDSLSNRKEVEADYNP